MIDGMTYKAPQTFDWASGSSHTLSVSSSPQPGASGTQYVFGRWNDGGSQSHAITASSGSSLYVASFNTQYSLTVFVTLPEGGKTGPSGTTWFNAGETVSLSATVNVGYLFAGWSGDVSGTQNPVPVLMDKAKIVTADFSGGTSSLMVNALPPTSGSVNKNPDKLTYTTGEQVTLTPVPNPGYVFKSWSGDLAGETSPTTLTVRGNMTVTANFVPVGSFDVTPSDGSKHLRQEGWNIRPQRSNLHPSQQKRKTAEVESREETQMGYDRSGKRESWAWTGNTGGGVDWQFGKANKRGLYSDAVVISNTANKADSQSRAVTLTVKPPVKTYSVKTYPDGLQVTVDGVPYVSPQMFEWEVGSSHTMEASSPQTGPPGVQYVFSSWSNRKPQSQTLVAPASGGTFTATFKVQYALTSELSGSPNVPLPIIGALESPSEGKRVLGLKDNLRIGFERRQEYRK